MRKLVLIIPAILLAPLLLTTSLPTARAAEVPTLSYVVLGSTNGTRQVFAPERLIVPQLPIHLIVTFHNNDTMVHSFTLNDENATVRVNTGTLNPGQNRTVNFTVTSLTRITFDGTSFTPEAGPDGILFYCIPHRGPGVVGQNMVGQIILASAEKGPVVEKGILLRAYWIGIIGIASMLAWIVISYFIIKSSSRHFSDHREHVRKGLP